MNTTPSRISAPLMLRAALGGVLMGLANLVPGISGGTMLLAAGVYPRFIEAVAQISRLRPRTAGVSLLAAVVLAAMGSVLLLAGPVKDLVVHHRWAMYSLFIGLTLGGLPVVLRMARPLDRNVRLGAVTGFILMAALALAQMAGTGAQGSSATWALFFAAGVAGASAMILPGVSGGYLLLVMGAYVPILSGIQNFRDALSAADSAALLDVGLGVILPVGLGVVLGVAAVSNVLRFALRRYEKFTLGLLIGLLLGAVVGLWPFRVPVQPVPGDVVRGEVVDEITLAEIEAEDWPTEGFRPGAGQVALSVLFIGFGFGVTTVVDRIGRGGSDA